MLTIKPAWARCDEDTRGLEAGRGGGAGGRVRNERRGNSANSKRGRDGVGDQERHVQSGGIGVVEDRGESC